MARNKDNAPVANTCPKIDQVISFLEKLDWDLKKQIFKLSDDDEKYLSFECKKIVEVMEEIRKANHALRTWGNEEYNSKNEHEQEIKDLKAEIENLEKKLSDVESVE